MVCIRLTSLFLCLLLSLAALGHSNATSYRAIDALTNSHHGLAANKELHIKAEATEATSRRTWLRGRKMGVQDVMKEMKGKVKKGANSSVGKCENENGGKNDLNLECELRVSRTLPSSVKLVGLIPFSSDYHAPKTHPPKNN